MKHKFILVILVFLFGQVFGQDKIPFEATLHASEEPIHFFEGAGKTDLMIYWKFTSTSQHLSRIRVREMGKPIITGPDGEEVEVSIAPVDLFKRYEISDYPALYPNQTLFFPFAIRIVNWDKFGQWIILANSPNWLDGYMFSPKSKGKYTIAMRYNSKKDNPDNAMSAEEQKAVGNAGFGLANYWEGEFISNKITIQIR